MKLTFLQSNKPNWGNLQKQIPEQLIKYLAGKQDFEVEFSEVAKSKSSKSLKGYWRLCGLLVPCFKKSYGEIFDKEMVSNAIKIRCNYSLKTKTGLILPKSLKIITQEEINILIEEIYKLCEFFGLKNYELMPDELREQENYFKK
jgi:hypothetical protein